MEEFSKQLTKKGVTKMLAGVEEIYQRRGITKKEKDFIWQAMACFCAYQVKERKGLFFDSVKDLLSH